MTARLGFIDNSVTLIANPMSGRGKGRRFARAVLRALREGGIRIDALWTGGRGHAETLARRAVEEGSPCLIVCGGDGTLHEVAQAVAGSSTVLIPVPAGRCNDFCRFVGLPSRPDAFTANITEGRPRSLDLARVNGRYYCTVGAVGFDAEVSRFVDDMRLPFLKGTPAYMYAALNTLRSYQPAQVEMVWDDGEYRGQMFMTAVANTPTYGNNIPVVPGARPDDGLLDLCLVSPVSFWRAVRLMPELLKGAHIKAPETRLLQTRRLTVTADRVVELWADGEPVAHTPLDIEIVPGALKVLAPLNGGKPDS